jgi:hypothetical protein
LPTAACLHDDPGSRRHARNHPVLAPLTALLAQRPARRRLSSSRNPETEFPRFISPAATSEKGMERDVSRRRLKKQTIHKEQKTGPDVDHALLHERGMNFPQEMRHVEQ